MVDAEPSPTYVPTAPCLRNLRARATLTEFYITTRFPHREIATCLPGVTQDLSLCESNTPTNEELLLYFLGEW